MTLENRLKKLEEQEARTALPADEIKARAQRWAAIFEGDPNFAPAVKDHSHKHPSADNLCLVRIVELFELAAGRRV